MTPEECAEKFHDCLRGNCSRHETWDDCEKEIATQIREVILKLCEGEDCFVAQKEQEAYQKGRASMQEEMEEEAMRCAEHRRLDHLAGRTIALEEAAKRLEWPHHFKNPEDQKLADLRNALAQEIRALKTEER